LTELEHHSGKLIGYTLTEKGKCFILRTNSSDTKCIQPIAPKKEEIKADVSELLIKWRDKLQELSDVANRIAANNVRKADLQAQINVINKENEELSKVLDHNKESQDVLNKLGKLITTLPLQGDKNMTNSLKGV
jgi:cell shape-determining protein MreC